MEVGDLVKVIASSPASQVAAGSVGVVCRIYRTSYDPSAWDVNYTEYCSIYLCDGSGTADVRKAYVKLFS